MLSVTLTLTNRDKAAKLLALLEELPFVEIQERQEMQPPVAANLSNLFSRYLEHKRLGNEVKIYTGSIQIEVFNGIGAAIEKEYGYQIIDELCQQLAHDPGVFNNQIIKFEENKAYCLYRNGFRILYELEKNSNILVVFHVVKAPTNIES
jgi:mRNA-degrading endonuclease RelE of RelBE toxin-antitoxin system